PIERAPGGGGCWGARRRSGWRFHRFRAPAEHQGHLSGRAELDDHAGAFIGGPEVVVGVDPNRVGKGKPVEILADFAKKGAARRELEELRGGGAVHRAALPGAGEDEKVAA